MYKIGDKFSYGHLDCSVTIEDIHLNKYGNYYIKGTTNLYKNRRKIGKLKLIFYNVDIINGNILPNNNEDFMEIEVQQ